jgi:hypothetical protein
MVTLPYIRIKAKNHEELGFKLGRALSKNIKARITSNKKIYSSWHAPGWETLRIRAKEFLPAIEKKYPELLAEAKAIAAGADVPFEDFLVLNCEEELMDFTMRCTSIAVKTNNGNIIIGHNDDWLPNYQKNGVYLIHAEIGKHKFLSLSYMGSIPGTSCGLNNSGIAYTGNSLDSRRFRKGVPRNFLMRALLDIKTVEEAKRIVTSPWKTICANTMVGNKKNVEDVESLWRKYKTFYGSKWLIHTNHPILKNDQNKKNTDKDSLKRYNLAVDIIKQDKKPSYKTIAKILTDHKSGICAHKKRGYNMTIASSIINPKKGWIDVCPSLPCRNKRKRYRL